MNLDDDTVDINPPTTTSNTPAQPEAVSGTALDNLIPECNRQIARMGIEAVPEDDRWFLQLKAASRQGDQHRPYCLLHNVLMVAYNSSGGATRYKCPVPECDATEKRAQPTSMIPRDPLFCPHCMARAIEAGQDKPQPVYLEADYARSTFAILLMKCPTAGCHFSIKIPRPDITARSRVQRSRTESISER